MTAGPALSGYRFPTARAEQFPDLAEHPRIRPTRAVATPATLERRSRSGKRTRTRTNSSSRAVGAYGLRVHGIAAVPTELTDAPAHWPTVELRVRVMSTPTPPTEYIDREHARLQVRSGGYVSMDRTSCRAEFTFSARPTASALLHPHLAAVGAVWSHWSGREAFHAGAFLAHGGVWGLLGEKGAGKSSMLAALARAGAPIVCDDVLVLDGSTALAGPRSIDLRADAARQLRMGESLGMVGERERWRVPLEAIAPELPFRGWVALRWSEQPALQRLLGVGRLRELLEHRALRVPPRVPTASVELASLPFLELCRPRRWSAIDDAAEQVLSALSG